MKNAVLAVGNYHVINIGDYIQGLASAQFFDNVDFYIERECLSSYDGDECRMIMNGWYMHHPENWPPSPKIKPLFVAFHINSTAKDYLLADKSIAYLKQHEPIGCRDVNSMNLLIDRGVDAYFSGCMTLTLGKSYRNELTNGQIYFVDPVSVVHPTISNFIKLIFRFIANFSTIIRILKKDFLTNKNFLQRLVFATAFVSQYKIIFSKKILLSANYLTQENLTKLYVKKGYDNNEKLSQYATELLSNYAKAKLVVTSRIHCALPCLAMQTPVLFVNHINKKEASACRMNGLLELFNVVDWDSKKSSFLKFKNSTDMIMNMKNSDKWRKYNDQLRLRCEEFVGEK